MQKPQCDVLVVCTGNVCRSPYIAALLSTALPELNTTSAGTRAPFRATVDEQIQQVLAKRGVPSDTHRSRRVNRRAAGEAALIITATRQHRGELVRRFPAVAPKVFTLKELARLISSTELPIGSADASPRDRVTALVAHVTDAATAQLDKHHDDNLDDPHGLEDEKYAVMIAEADAALDVIVPALRSQS
jgi:protein-tyrosine phosphatase